MRRARQNIRIAATSSCSALIILVSLLLPGTASAAGPGTSHLTGNASYADHSPDAGVEVVIAENHSGIGTSRQVYTDEAGDWDAGELSAGPYSVTYLVDISSGTGRTNQTLSSETVQLEAGMDKHLFVTLAGAKPEGMIEATMTAGEGWPASGATLSLTVPGSNPETAFGDAAGTARLFAPTGSYALRAEGPFLDDDAPTEQTVSVSNGHLTRVAVQISPFAVPAGTAAQNEQQDLAWLNGQRTRWGLPAGVASVPLWSAACAAHDAWEAQNGLLQHPENAGTPGYSPGGAWAGEHSVIANSIGLWSATSNPFFDAPIHLSQLFNPDLVSTGLDDSQNRQCVVTLPRHRQVAQDGSVFTFPGDGATGLPPAERAGEFPLTPNEYLGLPNLAGRQLLVYEEGAERGLGEENIASASLRSAAGSVPVKWIDGSDQLASFGAIIVPTKPLQANTLYTATVQLAEVNVEGNGQQIPPVSHSWSFTTGPDNPGGQWEEQPTSRTSEEASSGGRPRIRTAWKKGKVVIRGSKFPAGKVVLRRRVRLKSERSQNGKVLLVARVDAVGSFLGAKRWPKGKRLVFIAYEHGKKVVSGSYRPAARPKRHPSKVPK